MLELKKRIKAYQPNEPIEYTTRLPDGFPTSKLQVRARRPLFALSDTAKAMTFDGARGVFRLPEQGYYDVELLADDARLASKGLVVLPPHPLPQSLRMGMGLYGNRHSVEMFEDMVRLCAYIGIGTVREDVKWHLVERERDLPQWDNTDRIVDAYAKNNIDILAVICGSPDWTSTGPEGLKWCYPPTDPHDYAGFVRRLAERYWPRIRHYEVWNEPDWHLAKDYAISFAGTARQYASLLQTTSAALKALHGDVDVHTGGLSLCSKDGDFLADCIDACGGVCFDTLNLHGYGSWYSMDRQRSVAARFDADRETWLGEIGMAASTGGGSTSDKTAFLINRLTTSILKGIKRFIWYDFRNDGFDEENNEHNFGLITHDGYSLPALQAFITCSRLLGTADAVEEWDFGEAFICSACSTADRWVYVLRAQPDTLGCVSVRNVRLIDAYGYERDVGDRWEHLWLTSRPVFMLSARDADPRRAFEQRVEARTSMRS